MFKLLAALLLLLCTSMHCEAQVFPREHGLLNYRIIGFSFPQIPKANRYEIEIAEGDYNIVDSFNKHITHREESDSFRKIIEVPQWGKAYTWRVVYKSGGKKEGTVLYHFSTDVNDRVNTNKMRIRILQQSTSTYSNNYVFMESGGVLYDMKGNPIWYVPDTNGYNHFIVDGKFTKDGTITFLNKTGYEINYDGDVLWKAPNDGTVNGDKVNGENYHHEFTKLSNGHYMALGMEVLLCKLITKKHSSYVFVYDGKPGTEKSGYTQGRFGTLIEYDKDGKAVWNWKSSKYLIGSDFDYYEANVDTLKRFDPHPNAFFFDEKNHCIYYGSRNLNRIVKIDYPSGEILATYGANYKPGEKEVGAGLFCNQHNINRSQEGYLYYFNNNSCMNRDSLPSIVMIQEPTFATQDIKKVWEYTCTADGTFKGNFGSGGNVIELPNRTLFVCMGSEYSKTFIIDREKNILWSVLPERLMEPDNKWVPIHEYRANIISRAELERMIWKAEFIMAN